MEVTTPNYSAWLPANVRYDKEIPANAKLLFAELSCLSNTYGYSFATNKYFADLYDLSEDRVSRLIHILESKGYIKVEIERNENKFVINRRIYICQFTPSNVKNNESDSYFYQSPALKIPSSGVKNNESNNNTNNNNTNNNNTNKKTGTKSTFPKKDYDECRFILEANKSSLISQNKKVDTTVYSIPSINKFIKTAFLNYGIEDTKKGLINSVKNEWLVNIAHYSLNAVFSDKMFPKYISETYANANAVTNSQKHNDEKHHFIDHLNQNFAEGF